MTFATVQLIMGGLGIFTGLLIALLGPGSRWIRWPLAIATAAGVAIVAWPQLWLVKENPEFHLYQSLLLASVVVLVSLLTIMLLYPSRSVKLRAEQAASELTATTSSGINSGSASVAAPTSAKQVLEEFTTPKEPGRDPIALQLERSPDAMIANQDEHAQVHLLGPTKQTHATASNDVANSNQQQDFDESRTLLVETTSNAPMIDQAIENKLDTASNPSSAEVVSLAERREKREGEVAADSLDLSDSEELYQAMREAEAELDLPEDSPWLNENNDTEVETRRADNARKDAVRSSLVNDVEDAEILAIDENINPDATTADLPISEDYEATDYEAAAFDTQEFEATEFDTQEFKIPSSDADIDWDGIAETEAAVTEGLDHEVVAEEPATLDAALVAQRQSIAKLSTDTETLTHRLSEWRQLSDTQEQAAWKSSLQQGQTVRHLHQRILAENNFRLAAVDLIRTQRDVMRQLMQQIGTLGEQREEDLASLTSLQEASLSHRKLARQAALLARKAAADKQAAVTQLAGEKTAHARTQSAAKRAMHIAREAVDKLAMHEHRLGIADNRQKPDNKG